MYGFLWIVSLSFCFGGLPLSQKAGGLFRRHLLRHAATFLYGAGAGALVAWTARFLVGTPVSEVLAASGLILGRLLFPWRSWRQDDLRGMVAGVFLVFAPAVLPVLAVVWLVWYRLTREPATSSFFASLALLPMNLITRQSDIHFAFALFLVWVSAAGAFWHLERMARAGVAVYGGPVPRLYYFSRPVHRLLRAAVLAGLIGGVMAMAFFTRMVYSQVQPPGIFRGGAGEEMIVALTFDDGPHPYYTCEILDILKEKEVRATFFLVGAHVHQYPEVACRIAAEGHEIGNHTYSHANLYRRSFSKIQREIVLCSSVIAEITGIEPVLFRPPRGLYNAAVLEICADLDLTMVLWTVSSSDWIEPSVRDIVQQVDRRVHPGAVLLFHDSGDFLTASGGSRMNTVRALPKIIDLLQERGYTFVTVGEMIERAAAEKKDTEGEIEEAGVLPSS